MANSGPLRKFVLAVALIGLIGMGAVVGLIWWSSSGFFESRSPTDTEWLTVSNGEFEIRGNVYQTPEALQAGLQQLQPRPQLVTVRWVVAGASAAAEAPSVQVEQARSALARAHIATPPAVVGNEVFMGKPSAAPSSR